MKKLGYMAIMLVSLFLLFNCTRPASKASENKNVPKAEYKEIKPLEYEVPASLLEIFPGLLNDKIRIYQEISPTINLVAELRDYSLEKAIIQSAQAFLELLAHPEFQAGVEFWIIQVQPPKGGEVLVWGVKPEEVKKYKDTGDLKNFFADSEYVLINDQIIEKGEPRLKFLSPTKP